MDQKELNEARTNPEFLKYLEETKQNGIKDKDIVKLYEVLDTSLVLDLDTNIDEIYKNILIIAFDNIEQRLKQNKLLNLENEDLYYIRSFYEHGIEKWSLNDIKGAKELFFILSRIVDDKKLQKAFDVHILACAKEFNIDEFYNKKIASKYYDPTLQDEADEKYGYFISEFQFDIDDYLNQNSELLQQEFRKMEHLLN
jgi:hypothetical protein